MLTKGQKINDRYEIIKSIGEGAFCYCRSLIEITIPESITSIDSSAFRYCSSIKDVYYSGSQIMWISNSGLRSLEGDGVTIHYGKDSTGSCGEQLTWVFYESNRTLEISGSGDMYSYSYSGEAPWRGFYTIKTIISSMPKIANGNQNGNQTQNHVNQAGLLVSLIIKNTNHVIKPIAPIGN